MLEAWREEHSFTPEELRTFLHTKRTPSASAGDTGGASTSTSTTTTAAATVAAGKGGEANQLWQRLGRALRTRPLLAIYNHVKTVYPSLDASQSKGERWAAADDAALSAAVKELGNAWERVGAMVGRSATACRDRWTKQLNEGKGEVLRRGAWTQEEEDELRRLHAELGGQWKAISIKMGGKRSATQCRTKWCVANSAAPGRGPESASRLEADLRGVDDAQDRLHEAPRRCGRLGGVQVASRGPVAPRAPVRPRLRPAPRDRISHPRSPSVLVGVLGCIR